MKLILVHLVALLAILTSASLGGDSLRLVPAPKKIAPQSGVLTLTSSGRVVAADPRLMPLAKILAEEIAQCTGVSLQVANANAPAKPGDIVLGIDPADQGEAYTLKVDDKAVITAGDYYGVCSASATLLQAIVVSQGVITIPRMSIEDQPSYAYRGAMLDLARKYHSPDGIRQVIELCRLYKIRFLHLHLSDDHLFMFASTAFANAGKTNSEFARFEPAAKKHIDPYTLDELKDLEKFAAERGVYLVPEIDLPGHAGRLIADEHDIFGIPGNGSTVNIASPKTLAALTTLLNEVMDVFQSTPYVHLGADEVGLGGLDKTADYKAAREKDGIKSVHELYCKFVNEMHDVVARRGKKSIVWEEAANADGPFPLPKDTLVMVWSQGRDPNTLVKQGYSVVNATWVPLYIVRDNKKPLEFMFNWTVPEFGREGSEKFTTLADTKLLEGAQLCSWENSEAIEIQSMRDRLALVAERTWNAEAHGTLAEFKERLAHTDSILEKLVSPIGIEVTGKFAGNENAFVEPITITLTPRQSGLTLKYTLDNSLPSDNWQTYAGPITTDRTVYLRAGLFDSAGKQHGYLVGGWYKAEIPPKPNLATGKPVTVGPGPDRSDEWAAKVAVDGRADDPNHHWASVGHAPQWLQVDLQEVHPINYINVITYWDGGRYYQLNAEVSVDGKEWKRVLDFSNNKAIATAAGYGGKFPTTDARYVRINMLKNSANPDVHIVELIVDEKK